MNHSEANQYIKATLAAFGPNEAINLAQDTWAKLHEAMRVLIEQPADEPVAWICENSTRSLWWDKNQAVSRNAGHKFIPLYTRPQPAAQNELTCVCGAVWQGEEMVCTPHKKPSAQWVGLTDEDFQPMVHKAMMYYGYDPKHSTLTSGAGFYKLVRAIEAKLKEKNT